MVLLLAAIVVLALLVVFRRDVIDTATILYNYHRRLDWMVDTFKANGNKTWQHNLLGVSRPAHIFTDTRNVEFVLKGNFESFNKGLPFHERFEEMLGDGIFNTDGAKWFAQRKLASTMFTTRLMRESMSPVFERHNGYLMNRLEKLAASSDHIDIQDLFFRFTMDSIGDIAFGVNVDSLNKDKVPFATAFDIAQEYCQARFFTPLWRLERMWAKIPLLGALFCGSRYRRIMSHIRILNRFAADVIKARRSDPNLSSRTDLLSRFMNLPDDAFDGVQDLTDVFFRDVQMNFLIAGRDTTANAMSWCVYEIARHREVQVRLLEEIDEVLQGRMPTYESYTKMPYLQNVILETLRLHPSVPFDAKQAQKSCKLPDGTFVKAGQYVMYAIYASGRNPEIWGPDCLEFRPERWEAMAKRPSAFVYPVFNAGPRLCLGQTMALLEATMCLSALYQKYTFELMPGRKVTYAVTVTLPVKDGLWVKPVPRGVIHH